MKNFNFFPVFIIPLFIFSSILRAQVVEVPKEVVTTGVGFILAGDVAKARDDAINDAMRKALEKVLGLLVESETRVEHYQTIEDNIFTKTSGYIHSREIIREGRKEDELYEVVIRAVVKTADLENDLQAIGVLLREAGKPRLMVLMRESNMAEGGEEISINLNVSETTLIEEFRKKGFPFVDERAAKSGVEKEQALAAVYGDNNAAVLIGNKYNAELIIIGEAVARVAESMSEQIAPLKSCQADVTARAIKADDGTIIAEGRAHSAYPHINEITGGAIAIEKASRKLAQQLLAEILKRLKEEMASGKIIRLQIINLKSFTQLNQFKNALRYYIRGIIDLQQRNFTETVADIDVEIRGNAEKLAQELEGKTIGKFKVKVIGLSANKITVSIEDIPQE